MDSVCSICNVRLDTENAAILTMSGFGSPRYICEGCDGELSLATRARDISEIGAAMDRISKKMTENNVDDSLVLKTVEEIMSEASVRAEKIKGGNYDFSDEEAAELEDGTEEIPEELRESEEDRELDRIEAEKNKKLDKITNIICIVAIVAAVGFFAYKLISALI